MENQKINIESVNKIKLIPEFSLNSNSLANISFFTGVGTSICNIGNVNPKSASDEKILKRQISISYKKNVKRKYRKQSIKENLKNMIKLLSKIETENSSLNKFREEVELEVTKINYPKSTKTLRTKYNCLLENQLCNELTLGKNQSKLCNYTSKSQNSMYYETKEKNRVSKNEKYGTIFTQDNKSFADKKKNWNKSSNKSKSINALNIGSEKNFLQSFSNKSSDRKNIRQLSLNEFKLIIIHDFWGAIQIEILMEHPTDLKEIKDKYELKLTNLIEDIKNKNNNISYEKDNTFNDSISSKCFEKANKTIIKYYKLIKKLTNWYIYILFKNFRSLIIQKIKLSTSIINNKIKYYQEQKFSKHVSTIPSINDKSKMKINMIFENKTISNSKIRKKNNMHQQDELAIYIILKEMKDRLLQKVYLTR